MGAKCLTAPGFSETLAQWSIRQEIIILQKRSKTARSLMGICEFT